MVTPELACTWTSSQKLPEWNINKMHLNNFLSHSLQAPALFFHHLLFLLHFLTQAIACCIFCLARQYTLAPAPCALIRMKIIALCTKQYLQLI